MTQLQENFQKNIIPKMMSDFGYANQHQVPRLVKIVVNVGIGEAQSKQGLSEQIAKNVALITGQKPVITKARQSIAGFKIRAGEPVGLCVTLRGRKMYDFMGRLINITLPRIRDFRGLPISAFDGHGNYSIGIREQIVFPEIPYETAEHIHGLQISIATTASTDKEAKALLSYLGLPFEKEK